jgi:hypothetical protein
MTVAYLHDAERTGSTRALREAVRSINCSEIVSSTAYLRFPYYGLDGCRETVASFRLGWSASHPSTAKCNFSAP